MNLAQAQFHPICAIFMPIFSIEIWQSHSEHLHLGTGESVPFWMVQQ